MDPWCCIIEARRLPLDSTHQHRRCYVVDLHVRLLGTEAARAPYALGKDREGMLRPFLKTTSFVLGCDTGALHMTISCAKRIAKKYWDDP